MTENEIKLLNYLVAHCQTGRVRPDKPQTHLPYSLVNTELGFPADGRTPGDSLNHYAMGGLAQWLVDNRLPAITGIIINKLSDQKRPGLPSKPYFSFHDKEDYDFEWLREQIKLSCEINWDSELKTRGIILPSNFLLPDEIPETVIEGAKKTIIVNSYERSRTARNACIRQHGVVCTVCNFDFESFYGVRGKDFIHVHHLIPISEIRKEYELDPIEDLRPVCPNCHAMLHRKGNISIEELREEIAFNIAVRK